MVASVQFSVDDSSPLLTYTPFPDTFGQANLTAGWNPYFVESGFVSAIGQTGVGQSQHITSRNGSSISLHWHGTSLQLFGNTTAEATFSLALDGASVSPNNTNNTPNLLAFLDGLPPSDHVLVLTAFNPSPSSGSLVVFDKAVITDLPPQNSSDIFSDHTLDDNDISFTGQWSPPSVATPFHESRSQGETAQVTFSGISVRIFGTTSPTSGNYSIMLDDVQSPIFSARSSFTQLDSLLFFASGLDPNVSHHIVVRNEGGSLQLKSGGTAFDIFSSGEPTALPSPPTSPGNPPSTSSGIGKFARGTIAALVLAGFLAAALLTAVLFYFCIWRPRRRMRRRQQPLDAVEGATSQLHLSRKKEQDDAVGVVLDIGQQPQRRYPDDDIANTPIDALSPLSPTSPSNARPFDEQHRDVIKSPGFSRWKRDMNTLSGLTSIGLKFNHESADEKSPLSDNGRGNGFGSRRYESEVDDISPITPIGGSGGLGRMMSLTTQSSYRSLRRIGKKRSNGTNGGRGGEGGFPFRFNSASSRRSNNNNNNNGEGPVSSPRAREEDSLSGFTSLSYASNPNLRQSGDAAAAPATTATAPTTYLDVQPPSYAASVSRNTTSGSSSLNQSPHTSSGTPSARDVQERQTTRSSFEQRQQRQSSSTASSGNQPQLRQQRSDTRMRGIRMLGIGAGAGSTSTGGGVGGPISMRAAIRALSPRISRNRNGGGKKEEEEEVEEARDHVISPQPSIALASIGHGGYEQQRQENVVVPRIAPPPVMIPQRRKTDSPIRALPPIPIPATAVTSVPGSPSKLENQQQQQQQQQQQRSGRDVASIAIVPPSPSLPSSPPPPPSSSSLHSPTRLPPPPPPIVTTTTTERKPCINTKVARSSPSDAVGLPPLGTIQSFAEAAAIAINTGGFAFGEGGTSTPNAPVAVAGDATKAGKGQRETKRSSTASRVRFEEPSNVDSSTVVPMEGGNGKKKEEKAKFRLTPPTPLTGGGVVPASSSSSEYPPLLRDVLPIMTTGDYSRSSFLDFSSKASSLHSTPSVHRTQENSDNNTEDNGNNDRVWSMHLPGRRVPLPSPPMSSPSQYSNPTVLKSKWSNTTMQTTTRTLGGSSVSASSSSASSNNRSGYGSREQWVRGGRPLLTTTAATATDGENEGDVLSPMTRQNLFPFPLTIPPSPNMPEGFMGVEPSPSLMSPTVSLPVPISSTRKKGWRMEGGEENRDDDDEHRSRNRPSSRHTGNEGSTDATNSPTDSFPYSISDVHFRNSGVIGSESETDMLDEDRGQSRRGRRHPHPRHTHHSQHQHHHHHHQSRPPHPPLPSSTSLSPQRFDPSLSLSSSTSLSQQQQQQQHEERTPGITTIVQRVFGTSGSGNNNDGDGNGNGNGAASRTLRAAAGLLKPS
ncbi:hypothetical protein Agabi119p4_1511 [Agaricus bisporus var. burnettii]|uniref:Uncharacterized protein n=1 Tax=Agaricus bisporus var. burnettii TaxID=192524 RepID=A0A8H7F7B7_AGABI|nr:hypothetical protein Agabi119p4_1511 [Agaricus bisporus var. burnettii]